MISFKEPCQALGLNWFKTNAVKILYRKENTGHFVYIFNNVMSTGEGARAHVCVPADPEVLEQMADQLKEIADERRKNTGA